MRKHIGAALLAVMAAYSFAGEIVPKFSDYPVGKIYRGKHAKVKTEPDLDARFRTALVEAGARPVNFAGHYIVFLYSPGGGSITGSVIDAVTGEAVAGFPDAYIAGEETETFDAQYQANSSLMIITGQSAVDDDPVKTSCYDFKNNQFKSIKCR